MSEKISLISLSGGRSSALMLRLFIDKNNGSLPETMFVCFANTGKERRETLEFLNEISLRWVVKIHWLEYVSKNSFKETSFESASRNGEPFEQMMSDSRYMPNGRVRTCTQNLKVKVLESFMRTQGYEQGDYEEFIGFRADEEKRVLTAKSNPRNAERNLVFPLYELGITKEQVTGFWKKQPFHLRLAPHESNCDLCFLKGQSIRLRILREHPEIGEWWEKQERERERVFDGKISVKLLREKAFKSPSLPIVQENNELPCDCTD